MGKTMSRYDGSGIRNVIYGATIYGGGGGGACESGEMALDQYKQSHGIADDKDVMVQVLDPNDMDDSGYACCTAAMGAPTKFKEVLIAPYINGSFDHLRTVAGQQRKSIDYSIAVERGGFNTLVPLLIAMEKGIPFIDADGAGRAVPALDTLLLNINGLPTSPLTMSDDKGNRVSIELENAMDAVMGETIGRNLCVAFSQMGGLSGWMVRKRDINRCLPVGSITQCHDLGKFLRENKGPASENIFAKLAEATGIKCREIGRGTVTAVHNEQASGFDKGFVEVTGDDGRKWTTHFLNENLILEESSAQGGATRTLMTAPDIICYINTDTGAPLSNADIMNKDGQILIPHVAIGAVKVDEKWWSSGVDYVQKIWSRYFRILGKPDQRLVRYEDLT